MSEYTYMRESVPETNNGNCPCCLKQHRATKRGTVVRHGWQETGRQVGQWGQGFQWGECSGWGKRPLEMTDADALAILKSIDETLVRLRKDVQEHSQGADSYTEKVSLRDKRKLEGYETALTCLGLPFQRRTQSVKRQGIRVFYEDVEVFTITVPRGFAEVKVTPSGIGDWGGCTAFVVRSWESLRQRLLQELLETIEALEAQHKQIQEAVVYHRDNPSNGTPVAVEGPTVHFRREWGRGGRQFKRLACGSKAFSTKVTTVAKETTCKRCLASLAKD